jgi:hypothetical protein
MILPLILGTLGMVCILFSFIMDEFKTKYNQDSVINQIINIVGAGLLVYYSITLRGWPFLFLNVIWVGVAVIKLNTLLKK